MIEENLILAQSEYARLLEEIHMLQARITELTALRDDLVYHVCPALRAEYDEKIVSLERELMAANMYLRQLQRTIEILQAQMNQRQEPSMEKAEAQAKQENKEYEEDLRRKAEEAREFKKKWEESQWARHDQQEREKKEKEDKERKEKENKEKENQEQGDKEREGGEKQQQTGAENSDGAPSGDHTEGCQEESGGSSDQNGSETGRKSGEVECNTQKEESTAQKIKRLYRKIVKRLHPDVHPNATQHEMDLLNRAMKAFREGDLQQMERIWDELSGMEAPEDVFDDTPEGREKLRELLEKLKVRLRLLESEIDHIKKEFPYKLKQFLEDPAAVEEVRRGLQSRIDHVRKMNRQLEAFISELKEKIRKGEKL